MGVQDEVDKIPRSLQLSEEEDLSKSDEDTRQHHHSRNSPLETFEVERGHRPRPRNCGKEKTDEETSRENR